MLKRGGVRGGILRRKEMNEVKKNVGKVKVFLWSG